MEYKGKIVKLFAERDNWVAFRFVRASDKLNFSVSGNTAYPLYEGCEVIIEGEEYLDPTYGLKIKASKITPESKSEIVKQFLAKSVVGIGEKLAAEIVNMLGENAIEKINADPTVLLDIKGIQKKKYEQIVTSLADTKDFQLRLEIYDHFSGKITLNQLDKLIKYMNDETVSFESIKKNPYILIRKIDGFGFKTIDTFGKSCGFPTFGDERIYAASVYVLRELSYTKGHVFSDFNELLYEVGKLLVPDNPIFPKSVLKIFNDIRKNPENGYLFINDLPESYKEFGKSFSEDLETIYNISVNLLSETSEDIVIDDDRIYWRVLYWAEKQIADFTAKREHEKSRISIDNIPEKISEYSELSGIQLSDEQAEAVEKSLINSFSIITGGPGRGKSTIVDFIVHIWDDPDSIVCLAPTGKAAQRLASITGLKASTINRMLISEVMTPTIKGHRLFIVDEASMVGIQLFSKLLHCISDSDQLILIGDVDQLASIEPGTLLKDLINSGKVTTTKLEKGFRNAGSIELNAYSIKSGKTFKDFIWDNDSEFIESDSSNILENTISAYKNALNTYSREDILLLSPMKKIGYASVENLNRTISDLVSKGEISVPGKDLPPWSEDPFQFDFSNERKRVISFKVNDRVIQTVNNYYRKVKKDDGISEGVFNGDLGTIVDIDYFNQTLSVEYDEGGISLYKFLDAESELILAYAITVHKSQGSEAPCIICIMSSQHSFNLKKNLFYTAVTRAKKKLIIIGDKKTISITCKREDDSKRNSYLIQRIEEAASYL